MKDWTPKKHSFEERKGKGSVWAVVGIGVATLGGGLLGWIQRKKRATLERQVLDLSSPITAIEIGSGFDVELAFGQEPKAILEALPSTMPSIHYTIHDGVFQIYLSPEEPLSEQPRRVALSMALPSLQAITLLSDSSLYAEGVNEVEQFSLVQHASRIKGLQLETASCRIRLSGAFRSAVRLHSRYFDLQGVGNGKLKYDALVSSCTIALAGSSLAYLSGLSDEVSCSLSGRTKAHAPKFVAEDIRLVLSHDAQAEFRVAKSYSALLSERSHLILTGEGAKPKEVTITQQAKFIRCK